MSKTFFDLPPELCDPETARFHIVPVPYEASVCFMHGTAHGPDAILEVSDQIERIDEVLLNEYCQAGIATHPAVPSAESPAEEMQRIYQTVKPLFQPGKFPIILGGEHSITPPIVRAATEAYPQLSVLQFDAHSDLRHKYTTGGTFSHASAMRRVIEITPNLVQVGIRSFSAEELHECPTYLKNLITVPMLETEASLQAAIETILSRLTETVYITFDIDAFDPAFAPATGTPEPGGLTWRQATTILYEVSKAKKVIGADVVEVAPYQNGNIVTEYLAARLVAKIIAFN